MRISTILDVIFPPLCLGCRKNIGSGGVLCSQCSERITLNQTLFCGKCGLRLARGGLRPAEGGLRPADARKVCHKDFPYLLGAATDYNEIAKSLIHGLKFKFIRKAAEPLGRFLIQYTESLSLPTQKFIVIPLPLSDTRFRERGFNQSELIARIFAEHFSLSLETKLLVRTKNTRPQSETKNLAERRENIGGCFAAVNPGSLRGKNIFLVDDVTTSGATLLEAAAVLKIAGASKIIALTAARA